jgi:hypothetical protein
MVRARGGIAAVRQAPGVTLEGGKAIAAVLERAWRCTVSTHRVWRYLDDKHDRIPHWRIRGRVYADELEVEAWAARQAVYRRAAGP